jgi:DNA-binding response OmpR family regulator
MTRGPVLLIEDDPEFSRAIGLRLKHYGIDISTARNGTEGFWKAVCEHPAVIVSDLSMPDGDGQYLLGKLKDHPLTRDIPFIVLTGRHELGLERRLCNLGAVAYLRKPLVLAELTAALRSHITMEAPTECSPCCGEKS